MTKTIGIYHQIDIEALELVATLRAKNADAELVNEKLLQQGSQIGISEDTIKKRTRPARKAWFSEESPIVDQAASLFNEAGESERIALHVAVLIRAYPFFLDVLTEIGKAKQLGSSVRQSTIRDRISRRYGQEGNVRQGVQKVLQTLASWKQLQQTDEAGVYDLPRPQPVSRKICEILVASILDGGEKDALPIEAARTHPALFLFELTPLHVSDGGLLEQFSEGGSRRFVRLNQAGAISGNSKGGKDESSTEDSLDTNQRLDSYL